MSEKMVSEQVFLILVCYTENQYIPLRSRAYHSPEEAQEDNKEVMIKLKEFHRDKVKFMIKDFEVFTKK